MSMSSSLIEYDLKLKQYSDLPDTCNIFLEEMNIYQTKLYKQYRCCYRCVFVILLLYLLLIELDLIYCFCKR